jgi:hypothetical protein
MPGALFFRSLTMPYWPADYYADSGDYPCDDYMPSRSELREEEDDEEDDLDAHLKSIVATASPGLLQILAEGPSAEEIYHLEQVDYADVVQHAGTYTHRGDRWLVGWRRPQPHNPRDWDWDDLVLTIPLP